MSGDGEGPAGERVLVIDDDDVDRMAVRRALAAAGLDVAITEVGSVEAARDALRPGGFRWALADFLLPDGKAQDVLAAARRHDPRCSVIILTGRGDESLAAELMREGARDYIPKSSLTPDRLAASMRAAAALADAERLAKAAHEGHRFLADAAARLVRSIELDDVVREASRACLGPYADFCLLDLELEEAPRRIGFAHRDDEVESRHREAVSASTIEGGIEALLEHVTPSAAVDVDDAWLSRMGGGGDSLRELAPRHAVTLPLRGRGRLLGLLTFARCGESRFDELDLPILRRFADKVALALDNARLYRKLEEALVTRDRVLAVVAHDLRNPLGAIVGAAANLLALDLPEPARRRQLELIETAGRRMSRLVDDLVDVARLEEGALKISPAPARPAELIEDTLAVLEARAREQEVSFEVEIDEDVGPVRVDPTRGAQILSNLVDNAIRFTPAGGTVRVRASADGDVVRFRIIDEGPGIGAEDLPHLFERFWQSANDQRNGRAGLGLTIARGLVELHGGRIGARSELGEGSELWFELPRPTD